MVEEFLSYERDERLLSPRTVETYASNLRLFQEFFQCLDEGLTWETIDQDVIRDWMEDMLERGDKARSVNNRLTTLRMLYKWALAHNLVDKDPTRRIEPMKTDRPLPKFVREDEINRLLDSDLWQDTLEDVRARTIIIVFYETGIRLSELVGLDDADIDFHNRQLRVTGKGNKQRMVPFGNEMEQALRRYITCRNHEVGDTEPALFVDDKGRRVKGWWVRSEVKRLLSLVSTQKKLSPHVLRHTFATAMLNHGAGIESVRRLLGHTSVATTEIYTHTTFEQLKREYKDAHPRA